MSYNFDRREGPIFIKWFEGCSTNLAYNCLDRHVAGGRGDRVAIYCERNAVDESAPHQPDSYTYRELLQEVLRSTCQPSPGPIHAACSEGSRLPCHARVCLRVCVTCER